MEKIMHHFKKWIQPALIMAIFWIIAIVLWLRLDSPFYLFNFGYIGTALGIGIGVYESLPRKQKSIGRRLAQFLVGAYMLIFLGLMQRENMQIEGFFLYLLSGLFAGSVIHYLVAKIFGPLIFNRGWCGWACWTAMILDLLPYKQNPVGRLPRWGFLRYTHFFLSLSAILILWFVFGYRLADQSSAELYWLIAGNLLYYAAGIALAFALKDNRAFCKYVCPIPVLQKVTSRFALLKISSDQTRCTQCGACDRACPMDINVSAYAKEGKRVTSSECIYCMECVNQCAFGALDSNLQFDFGDCLIRYRK
jgi:polyferredoxin